MENLNHNIVRKTGAIVEVRHVREGRIEFSPTADGKGYVLDDGTYITNEQFSEIIELLNQIEKDNG